MGRSREEICLAAAESVERAAREGVIARTPALVGFDGFVDSIIRVVDRRRSMRADDFEAIETIGAFAGRIASASGKSTNIELVVEEDRFGGNGPLLAGALGRIGVPTTYIGAVGADDASREIAVIYGAFAARCEEVIPIAAPAHTDALEFADGKVMLGRPANVQRVTWERLVERVGLDGLRTRCARASLIAMVNWTLCGGVRGIWEGLIREVLPGLPAARRGVFIDLSDPAKRTDADVRGAIGVLREMDRLVPVTLGLNLAEAERIASVLGVEGLRDATDLGAGVGALAGRARRASGLSRVVIHPREGAAAADVSGEQAWVDGPFTARPKLSTGAGDHFGAGFAFASSIGLGVEESLAVGVAVSGAYVRDAESPTRERLCEFLRALPAPDPA